MTIIVDDDGKTDFDVIIPPTQTRKTIEMKFNFRASEADRVELLRKIFHDNFQAIIEKE